MQFQKVVELRRCKGKAWTLKKSGFRVVHAALLPSGEISAREGGVSLCSITVTLVSGWYLEAAVAIGGLISVSCSLWFTVSRCRSGRLWPSPRRCGKISSFGSFTFRLVFWFPDELLSISGFALWSLIVVCAVVTGSNLDEFQVTVLRFSKVAIGGEQGLRVVFGFSHSPVSPFGIVAHPSAMDSLLVGYGGAALLILVLQVIELYWISWRQLSRTRFGVVCIQLGVFGLSLI
ncbi:hypothetical protein Bca52824_023165 [Brassica carinata]|uniref:Uncharacterized protein n=1 Tax=Brassica carinata TaxID=52824 RepID=A0A8X7VI51_BRACI|nr:hypothetical protein Bca52824_023165 [Brassica carinata]